MNPRTARSQLMGGLIWGMSSALLESTELDERYARYVNDNFADYLVPVNADIPDVKVILVSEQDDHINPAGAYDPSPDLYDYAQTKAATMNYVKSLAKQLAPKGIRVNAVAPGPIWTPLQVSGGATQEKLEKLGGQTPLGRAGQPAELASIYVQLAAADASFATGQVYGSAGGSGQP